MTVSAQPFTRVLIEGLDIDYGQANEYFLKGVDQVDTNGRQLFIRSQKMPAILVTDLQGQLQHVIGGAGQHPSEFGDMGVLAISVDENAVWALDVNAQRVRLFEAGTYVNSFALPSYAPPGFGPSTHTFAFTGDEVVLPVHPSKGALAAAYDHAGNELRLIGEPMEFDARVASLTKGINDTLWRFHNDRWYAFHSYYPVITVFDRNFDQVDVIRYESKVTRFMTDNLANFRPEREGHAPPPTINDVQFFGDHVYVLSSGGLHQIDPKTGEVLNVAFFYGEGENFANVETPNVVLFSFAIVPDGSVILSHPAYLWNYPLWRARPDFIKPQPKTVQGR